jgi:uncharacterized membrane-anchored protein
VTGPLKDHPLRESLARELHARPYQSVRAPVRASHIAVVPADTGTGTVGGRDHLVDLCRRFDVAPPEADANHFSADLGPFRLRWERHAEFSSYTVIQAGPFAEPFAEAVIDQVPEDWLAALPGQVLAAVHLAFETDDAPSRSPQDLARLFAGNTVVGARVAGGRALVWSDFHLHDGFSRILVRDISLASLGAERQAGRMLQRLLEINSYRAMALLALPLARAAGPRIHDADRRLAAIAADMAARGSSSGAAGDAATDSALLHQLSEIAAEIEQVAAETSDRFSAARAYHALVDQRLNDLRQERIEGLQTFSEFLDRRFAPAMATCRATAVRQEDLSQRAARMASLLRTRVEVALSDQNSRLLESMNRRAKLALRLQQMVEGLSVVAISYYLVGLIGYALKGLHNAGVPVDPDLGMALSIPVAVGAVWYSIHHIRRRLMKA